MNGITKTNWYTHTFSPWRVVGDRRVVASASAWKTMEALGRYAMKADERFRVLVKVDVFEDWDGLMVDKDGGILHRGEDWHSEKPWASVSGMFIGKSRLRIDDVCRRLFDLIDATPRLDWLLPTKQPENVLRHWPRFRFPESGLPGTIGRYLQPQNLWLGTTVSGPDDTWRIPHLLKVPAKVRFLLMDPLLGDVDLRDALNPMHRRFDGVEVRETPILSAPRIDWAIVAGESGKVARAFNLAWARSIRDQCRAAGVPFFLKKCGRYVAMTWRDACQLLANPPAVDCHPDTVDVVRLKDPKGANPAEWPEDLRVREVPG